MKTLFCTGPAKTAVLVTNLGGRRRQKIMRFRDAHAALDWCINNAAMLVYTPAHPADN